MRNCFQNFNRSVMAIVLALLIGFAGSASANLRTCTDQDSSCRFITGVPQNPTALEAYATANAAALGYDPATQTVSSVAVANAAYEAAQTVGKLAVFGSPSKAEFVERFRQWQGWPGNRQLLLNDRISLTDFAAKANSPVGYRYPTASGLAALSRETGRPATALTASDIAAMDDRLNQLQADLAALATKVDGAGEIMVSIGGTLVTLQQAFDLLSAPTDAVSADSLMVSIDGEELTLQEAMGKLASRPSATTASRWSPLASWVALIGVPTLLFLAIVLGLRSKRNQNRIEAQAKTIDGYVDGEGSKRPGLAATVAGLQSETHDTRRRLDRVADQAAFAADRVFARPAGWALETEGELTQEDVDGVLSGNITLEEATLVFRQTMGPQTGQRRRFSLSVHFVKNGTTGKDEPRIAITGLGQGHDNGRSVQVLLVKPTVGAIQKAIVAALVDGKYPFTAESEVLDAPQAAA